LTYYFCTLHGILKPPSTAPFLYSSLSLFIAIILLSVHLYSCLLLLSTHYVSSSVIHNKWERFHNKVAARASIPGHVVAVKIENFEVHEKRKIGRESIVEDIVGEWYRDVIDLVLRSILNVVSLWFNFWFTFISIQLLLGYCEYTFVYFINMKRNILKFKITNYNLKASHLLK